MTAQPVPISRQPACGSCRHEAHILGCDWCLCTTSPVVGVYLDSRWSSCDYDDEPPD